MFFCNKEERNKFIEEKLPLVQSAVYKIPGSEVMAEDLLQVGFIGLLKAIDQHSEMMEMEFDLFAESMIRNEIDQYLRRAYPAVLN